MQSSKPYISLSLTLQWRAFVSILLEQLKLFSRYWSQTILPPLINLALYFLIFSFALGTKIKIVESINYNKFIVPGILMILVITSAFSNAAYSLFNKKFDKSLQSSLRAPIYPSTLILAYMAVSMLKTVVLTLLMAILLGFLSHLFVHAVLHFILILLLTSSLFSLFGLMAALIIKNFQSLALVQLILTPLIYLSGVFYSVDELPFWFAKITLLNPIYYIGDAFRFCMLNSIEIYKFIPLLILSVLVIMLFIVNLFLFKKGTYIN